MARLRERNKADKRDRIRQAALSLFAERGYDDTTMRDIARSAGVALGTLSLYAADKRDLTLLVFNEQIATLILAAVERSSQESLSLEDRITGFFGTFYEAWAANPRLARIFLQLNYYSGGMHGNEYQRSRRSIGLRLEMMVWEAVRKGEIAPTEAIDVIARSFFLLFSAAVRWWIGGEHPIAAEGVDQFRMLARLQIVGLDANDADFTE